MIKNEIRIITVIICVTFIGLTLPVVGKTFAAPIPDTGQTKCYNNITEIPCPAPGEPFYGQDAQYGINTQFYSDLGNGIIRDNVTGLEWQQATAPGIYNWEQANTYCDSLTLGGYSDWRLPTIKELSQLVDSSRYAHPKINTTNFPDTQTNNNMYWSSTVEAINAYNAWGVSFSAAAAYGNSKSSGSYVRAVRGGQATNSFIDNGNGTITDTANGLMWQKATAPGTYSWEQALAYCENLALAGFNDWRLTNRNELQTLVDYSRYSPSIDTIYFPNTAAFVYISSTTHAEYPNEAADVGFDVGSVRNGYKTGHGTSAVRAVRGGDVVQITTSTIFTTTTTSIPVTTTTSIYDAAYWKAAYDQAQLQLQQCQTALEECQNAPTTTTTAIPTNIELSSLNAIPSNQRVILKWQTETEGDNVGFNIWRAEGFVKVNDAVIPALGSPVSGSEYDFIDEWVLNGKRYFYLLEDIDINGISTFHGPVRAVPRWICGVGK
jgi:hypothetical protein